MTADSATFGDRLRRDRLALGLTQEELAEKAQVSPRAISDLERGLRTRPWRDTIHFLADALELAVTERTEMEAAARQASPPSSGAVGPGSPKDVATPRHNLPVSVTSFVGRERELARVEALIAETHLLTLTGSGGCGKTRLGLRAAADLVHRFPDGIWFVDLAPLTVPSLVPHTVAQTLEIREIPGRLMLTRLVEQRGSYARGVRLAATVSVDEIDPVSNLSEDVADHDAAVQSARTALGDAAFAVAWAEGAAMTTEQAVDYTLEEKDDG